MSAPGRSTSVPAKKCIPFPKICEISGFLYAYNLLLKAKKVGPGPISITGSVKLHGTHADIVIEYPEKIVFQSRNRIITPADDNHDCAKTLAPLRQQILVLTRQFAIRYEEINGMGTARTDVPIIIAGEWVGPKVQPAVALSQLPQKYFVIIGCRISDKWVPMEQYYDLDNETVGIYNISRGDFTTKSIDPKKPEDAKKIIMDLTLHVERECPWTKATFGISGVGEGIVWKVTHPHPLDLTSDPKYWFKSKGKIHRNTNTEALASNAKMNNADPKTRAKMFAENALTENRLRQGLDFLREMGFWKEYREEQFLEWLCRDVVEEEKLGLIDLRIDDNLLRDSIREIGKGWYEKNSGRARF